MRPCCTRSQRSILSRPLAGWAGVPLALAAHAGCAVASGASLASTRSELDEVIGDSVQVTWSCTDSPCPWGDSLSNPAIGWPESAAPVATRLGYTASPAPY